MSDFWVAIFDYDPFLVEKLPWHMIAKLESKTFFIFEVLFSASKSTSFTRWSILKKSWLHLITTMWLKIFIKLFSEKISVQNLTLITHINLFWLPCTYDIHSAFRIMYPITVQLFHVQFWVCRTGLTICIPIRKQSQSFCIIPMALLMPYCRSLHLTRKLNLLLKENSYESSKF